MHQSDQNNTSLLSYFHVCSLHLHSDSYQCSPSVNGDEPDINIGGFQMFEDAGHQVGKTRQQVSGRDGVQSESNGPWSGAM
jgi:hypothetical protein